MQLNSDNFILFASQSYKNEQCLTTDEFYSDLLLTIHLTKLFTKYQNNGDLKHRLILNHIICFLNVFPGKNGIQILFYKIDKKYHSFLKTCLLYMGRISKTDYPTVPVDIVILTKLNSMET